MRPSLAHRKTESPFYLSNYKFIKTSEKQTQEKLFCKHYAFRLPIPLEKKKEKHILHQQGMEDEYCSKWDRMKGDTQHI